MTPSENEFDSATVTKKSGSNFASSFWFLPKEKRQALTAVYAYCRLTDDIVDLAQSPREIEEAKTNLETWRRETVKACRGKAEHPVLREISDVIRNYKIPEDYFHQLIDGVKMDLEKNSYKNFEELYPYCYRVASVVGLICLEVFGYQNAKTRDYGVNLGIAFQLTNILRDIKTDADRGRVYIPEQDLSKFGLRREDLLALAKQDGSFQKSEELENLIQHECRVAEHFYRKAEENLTAQDRKNLVAAEVMCSVYKSILTKIEKNGLAVLKKKIRLSKPEAVFRVFAGWARNRLKL